MINTIALTALCISCDHRLSTPSLVLYPLSTLWRLWDLVSRVAWPRASRGPRLALPPRALSCFAAWRSKYLKMCVRPRTHNCEYIHRKTFRSSTRNQCKTLAAGLTTWPFLWITPNTKIYVKHTVIVWVYEKNYQKIIMVIIFCVLKNCAEHWHT